MRLEEGLAGLSRLFLDTAPVIYFVERHPQFSAIVDPIFTRLDQDIMAVVSPITLAECLVMPRRSGLTDLETLFLEILDQDTVLFVNLDRQIAKEAARLRADYNLQLADAFQVAAALDSKCEAMLTNDLQLKRVKELRVLVVGELEVAE
jgi:predicted nucleic acid-binding protein